MSQSELTHIDLNIPLIIDLDGTLIKTDSLHEGLVTSLLKKPSSIFKILPSLLKGKSIFKETVNSIAQISAEVFCYRESLLKLIKEEKSRGRKVYLVTAANQEIANSVQKHLQLFDEVQGSDSQQNLKGKHKLAWLKNRFREGFIYAGDHKADLPIWKESTAAVLVGDGKQQLHTVKKFNIPYMVIEDAPFSKVREWIRQLRLHQWAKNFLLFIPLLLAHLSTDTHALLKTFTGFIAFGLIASATYIINDLFDIEVDRRHKTKRFRPIAAGTITAKQAVLACILLMGIGGATIINLSLSTAICVAAYVFVTLIYSFKLKRIPMLDVAVIGTLFTLRIIMGSTLNDLPLSPWLNSFSALFFFSLALAKRHVEVLKSPPGSVSQTNGRGYIHSDWPLTLAFGVASSVCSIVIMLLFLTQEAMISVQYSSPNWLLVEPACVFLWTLRIWLLSNRKLLNDDPVIFAVKDRTSIFLGFIAVCGFVFANY